MNAIAIDSAVSKLSIAAKNNDFTVSAVFDIGMKQSETLLPAIDYVLTKAGLTAKDLDYTVLCAGPGSFTGLRLAFAALKAIELASDIPLYSISTLEVYAEPYNNLPFLIIPAIDAKKEHFYAAAYKSGKEIMTAGDYAPAEIAGTLKDYPEMIACGPDAQLIAEQIKKSLPDKKIYTQPFSILTTDSLFRIAEKNIAGGVPPLKDFGGPVYLRASEAEANLNS